MASVSCPAGAGLDSMTWAGDPLMLEQPACSSWHVETTPSHPASRATNHRADSETTFRAGGMLSAMLFGITAGGRNIARVYARRGRQVRSLGFNGTKANDGSFGSIFGPSAWKSKLNRPNFPQINQLRFVSREKIGGNRRFFDRIVRYSPVWDLGGSVAGSTLVAGSGAWEIFGSGLGKTLDPISTRSNSARSTSLRSTR